MMSDQVDTDNQMLDELKYSHDQKKLVSEKELCWVTERDIAVFHLDTICLWVGC